MVTDMKTKTLRLKSRITAFLTAVIIMATSVTPAYAFFSTNSLLTNELNGNNWMSGIKDNTSLADITIPGTHDSGTVYVDGIAGAWATTQPTTIADQLKLGVRYLDLRLMRDTGVNYNVRLVHGSINCYNASGGYLTLYEVFEDIYSFLNQNPTETVIVSVKKDAGDNINLLADDINNLINLKSNYWYTSRTTPQLGNVRGKCVLAYRIGELGRGLNLNWGDQGSDGGAVDFGHMKVQDRYNMGTSNKWSNAVKPMLDETKPDGKWYINHLSTTGGGIASVKSNAGTMNSQMYQYEMRNNKCYGIILADYMSDDIAKKIFKCNDLVAKNQPSPDLGQYYYRINFNTTDNAPSGWSYVSLRLYYKENNGTGIERSVLIFDNSDTHNGYHFVCAVGNYDFSGYVNGFPTRFEFSYSWNNGSDRLAIEQRLYVSASPADNMTLCCKNNFDGTDLQGVESHYSLQNVYPFADSIRFANSNNLTVSAPQIESSSVNSYTNDCSVYDQYGVKWYSGPTSYSLSATYGGITLDGSTIKVSSDANNIPKNSSFYIYSNYTDSKSNISSNGKKITVTANKINYSFVNEDGEVLQRGSDYAGIIPVYTGNTPIKAPDENYHYTFSSWSLGGLLSISGDNIFTAVYNRTGHMVNRTVISVNPTCTQTGYNTNSCYCGYAWTVPTAATGHNLVAESKEPTCTQDGYTSVYCKTCGHIESQEIIPCTGHDYNNTYQGEHVDASENGNGYLPYFCSICNEELIDLREYDTTDWSKYYDSLSIIDAIKSDSDYSSYNSELTKALEEAVNRAKDIENETQSEVIQIHIDEVTKALNEAIDDFCDGAGVKYCTLTFTFNDSSIKKLVYKAGTLAENIDVPENTPVLMTQSTHTIYRWPTIRNVTKNTVYKESSATSLHTFNTFICPDVTHPADCTEDGYTEHTCLCGYTYNEKTADATGHSFGNWKSNGDGTHSRTCSNDANHMETESCIINLALHKCIICEYELDLSVYNAVISIIGNEMLLTDKYTADSLEHLSEAYMNAQTEIALADTQTDIDKIVFDLQTAISALELRQYGLRFYCVIDYDFSAAVESFTKTYSYGEVIELSLPENILNHYSVEKWTVEDLSDGSTKNLLTTASSVNAVIEKDAEYIAYIHTGKNTVSDTTSKITLLDHNGKAAEILYLPNDTYSITTNGNTITLSSNESTYTLTAGSCVFYRISGFTIDDKALTDTIDIQSNIEITPIYSV